MGLIKNKLPALIKRFISLHSESVLVGVPAEKTARKTGTINNATLAYIHDNGSPANNIPARPFMRPGIDDAKEDVQNQLKIGASKVIKGDKSAMDVALNRVGLLTQASIQSKIDSGIAPELKRSTLKSRASKRPNRKGAKNELQKHEEGNVVPLIDTGELRNSISYVIRGE